MLMVKPGMPYLDLVREVKTRVSNSCASGSIQCPEEGRWGGGAVWMPKPEWQ